MERTFQVVSLAVLPLWLLMIVLPRWRVTKVVIGSAWVLVPLPVLYVVLLAPWVGELLPPLMRLTLSDVAGVLGRPEGALIGWVHYLAFDFFVGRWEYLDGRARGIRAWLMAPPLILTLLLGPCGLLAYLALRGAVGGASPGSSPSADT